MKRLFLIIFIIHICLKIFTQTYKKTEILTGIVGPDITILYPLYNDTEINKLKRKGVIFKIKKPLLIINNIVIRDSLIMNYFRKNYLSYIIKSKYQTKIESQKLNVLNIPNDGVLMVYINKNMILDLFKNTE